MKLPILGAIDERFLTHRLRSTSIAGIAGVLMTAAFFFYHYFADGVIRWELFAIITTVAVVKVAVMVWYRLTD